MFYKIFVVFFLMIGLLKFALDAPNLFKTIFGEGGFLKGKINPFSELKSTWDDAKKVGSTVKKGYDTVKKGYDNLNKGGRAIAGGVSGFKAGFDTASQGGTGLKGFRKGLSGGVRGMIKGGKAAADTKISWLEDNFGDQFENAKEAGKRAGLKYNNPQASRFAQASETFKNNVKAIYNDDADTDIKTAKDKKDKLKEDKRKYTDKRKQEVYNEAYKDEFANLKRQKTRDADIQASSVTTSEYERLIKEEAAKNGMTVEQFMDKAASGKPEDEKFKKLHDDIDAAANKAGADYKKQRLEAIDAEAAAEARTRAGITAQQAADKGGIISQETAALFDNEIAKLDNEIAKKRAASLSTQTQLNNIVDNMDAMFAEQNKAIQNADVNEVFEKAIQRAMADFGSSGNKANSEKIDKAAADLGLNLNGKASDGTMTYEEMKQIYEKLKKVHVDSMNEDEKIALNLIVSKVNDVNEKTQQGVMSQIQSAKSDKK